MYPENVHSGWEVIAVNCYRAHLDMIDDPDYSAIKVYDFHFLNRHVVFHIKM